MHGLPTLLHALYKRPLHLECLPFLPLQGAPFHPPAQRGLCVNPPEAVCCSTPVALPELLV